MYKIYFSIVVGFALSIGVQSQCITNSSNIYTFQYNGDSYEIIKENLNWEDAAACAVERGGVLAEINSQEEQDSIFYHVNNAGISANLTIAPDGGGASYLWLGGNDMLIEGNWVWNGDNDTGYVQFWQGTSSGSAVNGLFNNWGNEPDDYAGQDALGLAFTNWPLGTAGQWNDVDDQNTLYYIIEYSSTPSSVYDFGVGARINVYPNPSNGVVNIEASKDLKISNDSHIEIFNLSGELVRSIDLSSTTIVLENLDNGIYFIKLVQESNTSLISKLVVNK